MAYDKKYLLLPLPVTPNGASIWTYRDTVTPAAFSAASYLTDLPAEGARIGDIIEYTQVDNQETPTVVTARTRHVVTAVSRSAGTYSLSGGDIPLNTTATTLALTAAAHSERTVTVSSAAPIAITLPASSGSGAKFKLQMQVAATATGHTIKVANATDIIQGIVLALTTTSDAVVGFKTSATSDTITLNGTTLGGVVGDIIELEDVKAGFWSVKMRTAPTGSHATPFSASV